MGFLNPWLYSGGFKTLTDVTGGGSEGCTGRSLDGLPIVGASVIPYASWNATVGWDPVTGWGLPNLDAMLNVPFNQTCKLSFLKDAVYLLNYGNCYL